MLKKTKYDNSYNTPLLPIIIALSVIVGIVLGVFFKSRFIGNKLSVVNSSTEKISSILDTIDELYVDTVDIQNAVEDAIPHILAELDPHSIYVKAEDAQTAYDDLNGSFSGIGVMFVVHSDTIYISDVIKGGPSDRAGIYPGDKILEIDGVPYVGSEISNEGAIRKLKGKRKTQVTLGILRKNEKLEFVVTRDDILVSSIETSYMLTTDLGYMNIKNFGKNTFIEFMSHMQKLRSQGMKGLVLDLRDNGGGYMEPAIQISNEFLNKGDRVMYSSGRRTPRRDYICEIDGDYKDIPLIVLTNENSASAAEIFSGAIQDNDRGVIVGRRTFGKGLVQQPIQFNDGSILTLTIARYYTPSGRCIQKPYTKGDIDSYKMDVVSRFDNGEFFNEDSIKQSGEEYKTVGGRTVYGGGGITPDYFIPEDTTDITPYFKELIENNIILDFCFTYTDQNRKTLTRYTSYNTLLKHLESQHLVEACARFADHKNIKRRNNMIIKSQDRLKRNIYSNIIYHILGVQESQKYLNTFDKNISKAKELYLNSQTFPLLNNPH